MTEVAPPKRGRKTREKKQKVLLSNSFLRIHFALCEFIFFFVSSENEPLMPTVMRTWNLN